MKLRLFGLLVLGASGASGQNPLRHFADAIDARFARSQPVLSYLLTIRDGDTTGWDVTMRVRNAPDTFRVAMAKHPEYDDRFFRYLTNLRVDGARAAASIAAMDSTMWTVVAPGGEVTISYRVQLPPASSARGAWRPFLSPTGGLTGGPHAFMYVMGAELAPANIELSIPPAWAVATGLTPTMDPRRFYAATALVLMESPIFVGRFRSWGFSADGTPHTIVYWPLPNGTPFDTTSFRRGVELVTNEAVKLFGRAPYREYVFIFQDGAFGGLEHPGSVTLGALSAELARNPNAYLAETAHEYFHTWNLMRIRPAEYGDVTTKTIAPVPTLWFSEGLTIFYADLLRRRAGVPMPPSDSTRSLHLETLIARYLAQPGTAKFSAEAVSRVAYNARPDALGDYDASAHLMGEVLGSMLDLIIRDATDGRRSMDDVMRLMLERFSGQRGFGTKDIERAVGDVCRCSVRPFFDAYVRSAHQVTFDKYLGLLGLRAVVTRQPVVREGATVPDLRIRAWNAPPDSALSLLISDPGTAWGRAGLHSRDVVTSVNGTPVRTSQEFRQAIGSAHIGDTLTLVVRSPGSSAPRNVRVPITGFDRPVVRIEALGSASAKQLRLRQAWLAGQP